MPIDIGTPPNNGNTPLFTASTIGCSGTGTVATVTYSGSAVSVGDLVTVSGVTPAGYNGTAFVTSSSAGSISYACTARGAQTGTGTIAPAISLIPRIVQQNLTRRLYCAANGIPHVDIWPLLATNIGTYQAGLNIDNTHYTVAAASTCGDLLNTVIANYPKRTAKPLLSYTDSASDHNSFISNSVSWGAVGNTTLPSGWSTMGSGVTYLVVAPSAGDFGNWMQVTASSPVTGGLQASTSFTSLGWSVGDILAVGFNLKASCSLTGTVVSGNSVFGIQLYMQMFNTGNRVLSSFIAPNDGKTTYIYREVAIPSGTNGYIYFEMYASGSGSGSFSIQRPMIVNLTKMASVLGVPVSKLMSTI